MSKYIRLNVIYYHIVHIVSELISMIVVFEEI